MGRFDFDAQWVTLHEELLVAEEGLQVAEGMLKDAERTAREAYKNVRRAFLAQKNRERELTAKN